MTDSGKFAVIPKRWVVEKTFAWFESYRRFSKYFDLNADTREAMIQLAMIKLMLNRIHKYNLNSFLVNNGTIEL